jgi:hypothetical protein
MDTDPAPPVTGSPDPIPLGNPAVVEAETIETVDHDASTGAGDEDKDTTLEPDCPKAHMQTKKGRFVYLKSLSENKTYRMMLRSMERIKVINFISQSMS